MRKPGGSGLRKSREWLWLAAPLVAAAVAWAPALGNGFAMDDRLVALGVNDAGQPSPRIWELRPLSEYFNEPYWADVHSGDTLYRPLVILSFALRHRIFGDAAWPEHAVNIALHLLATALVYALLRRLRASPSAAGAGTAVFALHAIHSEVVASVVGRAELLAFVGGAGATVLYLRALDPGRPLRSARLLRAASGLALLAALLSKESAVGWVAVLPAFEWAVRWQLATQSEVVRDRERRGRRRVRAAVRLLAVVGVPLAVFLLLRAHMLAGQSGPPEPVLYVVNPIAHVATPVRVATATVALALGLLLTAAPFRLAADYGAEVFPHLSGFGDPRFLVAAAPVAVLAIEAWHRRRRDPELFVAVVAFFALIGVASNLLFPIGTIFGERLYYAPSLAASLVVAWTVRRLGGRPVAERALLVGLGLWLGASTTVLVSRTPLWKDDASLFLHEADHVPSSVRMQTTAATILVGRGEKMAAEHRIRRALELDPEYALGWNNLAALELERGDLVAAERSARRGLAAKHSHPIEDEYKLRCNLGLILAARGDAAAGARELAASLALEPRFVRAWQELVRLETAGRIDERGLGAALDAARAGHPDDPIWSLYEGLLDHLRGRYEAAQAELSRALSGLPRHGTGAAVWSEGALARSGSLWRLGRAADAVELLRGLVDDPFTPGPERDQARRGLEQIAGLRGAAGPPG
jgi:tetratricopeptide (TPR) repeat protein